MDNLMMGGDHASAVMALLYLPVVITALFVALEVGASAGLAAAVSVRRAYLNSAPRVRLAALGMVISATIHLALVPSHLAEDHVRAVLFALDGVALSSGRNRGADASTPGLARHRSGCPERGD